MLAGHLLQCNCNVWNRTDENACVDATIGYRRFGVAKAAAGDGESGTPAFNKDGVA
jgi:hypothetical protein